MRTAPEEREVDAYVNALVEEFKVYICAEYQIEKFDLKMIVRYSDRYRKSWGGVKHGKPYISLVVSPYINCRSHQHFNEYAHIKNDAEIGEFWGSWRKVIGALIAHELAHCVEYMNKLLYTKSAALSNETGFGNHGAVWQKIYRDLRGNFINSHFYRDITYVVPPVKDDVIKLGPRRAKAERKITVTKSRVKNSSINGTLIDYYVDKLLVATVFQSPGHYLQYFDLEQKQWIFTKTTSLVEVRKMLIK